MEIVELYEKSHGRLCERVHQKGVGYDLHSIGNEERFIEVKGISESWNTYTWQPLHHTEVKTLQNDPAHFFLYIVHFEIVKANRTQEYLSTAQHQLFVIPGRQLLTSFRVVPESFALKPISRKSLSPFSVENLVVHHPVEDI